MSDAPQLVRLDRALQPIRRIIRYGLTPDAQLRYVEANVGRHLTAAMALPLPEPLRAHLEQVATEVQGFDYAPANERRQRLSAAYAHLARLDAVAGLPMERPLLRPLKKPVQRDEPEPVEASAADHSRGRDRSKKSARVRGPKPLRIQIDASSSLDQFWPADLVATAAERQLHTVAELLALEPESFEDLPVVDSGAVGEGRVAVRGSLGASWSIVHPSGARTRWSRLRGAGSLQVRWQHEIGTPWRTSDRPAVVAGNHGGDGVLVDAELVAASDATARLASYALSGIPDAAIRAVVRLHTQFGPTLRDPISPKVLASLKLPTRQVAASGAHVGEPSARRRMAFDEAMLVQLAGYLSRGQSPRGIGHVVLHGFAGRLGQIHGIQLNDAQQRCLEEIKRDLRSPSPMRRVLTGEVGGGRGLVALVAGAMVAEGRNQVMVLADDDVAASTRFLFSEPLLKEAKVTAKMVQSPPTGSQRDAIRRGETQVVFGSVELLEQDVEFRRLGLVIVIERDGWGRAGLLCDALPHPSPDLLVVPAVPVGPRLLFTAYAGYDVSLLVDQERRPARITVCHAGHRARAYGQLRDVAGEGKQAVVVFPMVRGRDALDVRGATRLVRALEDELLQGITVGLDHGGMPPEERRRVHQDFAHRRVQVLVSTTRIEEGPTVPGATLVVVEQADSMEAWRLHRIIGFLSRSEARGDAILVSGDLATEEAIVSLRRLQEAPSGLALTELRVSSQGTTVAEGVAPMPRLRWLDVDADLDMVLAARAEAQETFHSDPSLRRGANPELARMLLAQWSTLWPGDASEWTPPRLDTGPEPSRKRRRRRRKRR